jgi:hypothetical protein
MSTQLQCPVDAVLVNENKARVNAFFVLVLGIVFLFTHLWLIIAVFAADFLIRAAGTGKYSAIGFLSGAVMRQLNIGSKPVDRAPKRFAAYTGFVFSVAILASVLFQWGLAVNVLTAVLILFAFLEAFAGFCAGCYVYTLTRIILKKRI